MAEKPADPTTITGSQEPARSRRKPSKKPRVTINKEDISLPQDVDHFYHMGPTDARDVPRGLNMQLPTPCPGKVNDQTDGNLSLSPGCPVGSIIVKESVIDELKQEVEDLRSAATTLIEKADHIARRIESLKESDTALPNRTGDNVRNYNDAGLSNADEDDNNTGDRVIYKNTPNNDAGPAICNDRVTSNVVNMTYGMDNGTTEVTHTLSGDSNAKAHGAAAEETRKQTAAMVSAIGPFLKALPAKLHAKADVRECLSNALRVHCPDIIDNVVFRESELPDELIADSCITEDECCDIRQRPNRRDQMRLLLSAIRGRDVIVLDKFLDRIKRTNADIAEAIQMTNLECMDKKVRSLLCARCMMIERVNVKYVCDNLMAVHAVGEGLYNEIISDTKPAGAQESLWNSLFDTLNFLPMKDRKFAFQILADTLMKKHYKYIHDRMKGSITYGRTFDCQCHSKLQILTRGSDPIETFSPRSSTDATRDSRDSGELLSDTYRKDVHSGTEPRHAVVPTKERRFAKCGNFSGSLSDMDVPETISENKDIDDGDTANGNPDDDNAPEKPSSNVKESTYV